MICSNCGNSVPELFQVCGYCGNKLEGFDSSKEKDVYAKDSTDSDEYRKVCLVCNKLYPPDMIYCGICGERMKQLVPISHNTTIYEKGHKNIEGFDVELEGDVTKICPRCQRKYPEYPMRCKCGTKLVPLDSVDYEDGLSLRQNYDRSLRVMMLGFVSCCIALFGIPFPFIKASVLWASKTVSLTEEPSVCGLFIILGVIGLLFSYFKKPAGLLIVGAIYLIGTILEGEGAEVSVSVGATSVSIGETTYLSGFYIMVLGAICMIATGIYGIRCDRNR